MTPDNITGGGDLKAHSLFENIETLLKKKNYKEALEIIETNKTYLQTHSDMKYQVLLNKYNADALYHVTLYAYEKDSDEMLFEKLFTEHRSYLEVHLDKQSYARLLKIEGFIKNRRRAKRTRILAPVLIIAILAGSFAIYRAFNNDKPPAITQNGDDAQTPEQSEVSDLKTLIPILLRILMAALSMPRMKRPTFMMMMIFLTLKISPAIIYFLVILRNSPELISRI